MDPRSTKAKCVRRRLFGPVDPSQLRQDFLQDMYASMEKAKQKWNFDFLQEVPAEGLLQWEELQEQEVPAFYRSCVVVGARKPLQPVNWTVVAREAQTCHTVKRVENARPAKKTGGKKSQERKKRRQMSLTDYYTTKKQVRMEMQTPEKKPAF